MCLRNSEPSTRPASTQLRSRKLARRGHRVSRWPRSVSVEGALFMNQPATNTTARDHRRVVEGALIPSAGRLRRGGFWLYLIPGFVLFTIIIAVPLAWNVVLSFTSWRGILPPKFIGLENWTRLFNDHQFW